MKDQESTSPESDLKTLDKSGKPPKHRIKDGRSAHVIYTQLTKDDEISSKNRARVQKMLDGEPPFDQAKLHETGQKDRCNLNFRDGEAALEQALSGYYDLIDSVESLVRVELDPTFKEDQDRAEYEGIMAEEFHRVLKSWPEFEARYQALCHEFVAHGVGVTYFENDVDWRWRVSGLNSFKVPRGTKCSESSLELAVCEREMTPSELYRYIEDESTAKEAGWNVDQAKKILIDLCSSQGSGGPVNMSDWEEVQTQLKNNDLFVTLGADSGRMKIRVVHMWVKEFSGKVSHVIIQRDNGEEKEFLFNHPERFDKIEDCLTLFTYGIGTNGTLHSVRGFGHRIFPFVQTINRLRCQLVDGARLASSVMLQPRDAISKQDLALVFSSGVAVLPPAVNVLQNNTLPNVSTNAMPVVGELTNTMQNNTGSFRTRAVGSSGAERTKFEVQAQLQQETVLTTSAINLFYRPWSKLLDNCFRRFLNRNVTASDAGGKEIMEFRKRCIKRGLPEEAFDHVESVTAMRAVGYGSSQNRMLAFDEFMQLYSELDEPGRMNLLRDRFASRVSYAHVDRYVTRPEAGQRRSFDAKVAGLENHSLLNNVPIEVSGDENHLSHAKEHLPYAEQVISSSFDQGAATEDRVAGAENILVHIQAHMGYLQPDGPAASEVKQVFKYFSQVAANFQRLALSYHKQQETDARSAARGITSESPEEQKMKREHAMKQQMIWDDHLLKQRIRLSEAMQRMSLKDAQTAEKLRQQ